MTVANRPGLHGSFAKASSDQRVSLTFGFHRRAVVIGQRGALVVSDNEIYDEARIFERDSHSH